MSEAKENINDILNPENINFLKISSNKEIENLNGYELNKYRTNEILSSGNYRALASAYIDSVSYTHLTLPTILLV